MLENIFDLGHQTVKDVMIPWARVQYLSRSATRDEVMRVLAEHRFSRWPVLDPDTRDADRLLINEGYDCAIAWGHCLDEPHPAAASR